MWHCQFLLGREVVCGCIKYGLKGGSPHRDHTIPFHKSPFPLTAPKTMKSPLNSNPTNCDAAFSHGPFLSVPDERTPMLKPEVSSVRVVRSDESCGSPIDEEAVAAGLVDKAASQPGGPQ